MNILFIVLLSALISVLCLYYVIIFSMLFRGVYDRWRDFLLELIPFCALVREYCPDSVHSVWKHIRKMKW
jgi:hypothetical protein